MSRSHLSPRPMSARRDEGSVLPMILGLMVVGSLGVLALLTFATTLFTNRPPIETRDRTFWSAKSAMAMAMTLQREYGPAGCYRSTDSFPLNGFTANVTCTPTGNYFGTGRGRFAVITTSNSATDVQLRGRGAAAAVKRVTGDVFVNGGAFGANTADLAVVSPNAGIPAILATSNYPTTPDPADPVPTPATPAARYANPSIVPPAPATPTDCTNAAIAPTMLFPNSGTAWSRICQIAPWWKMAGDLNASGTFDYPELPPLPAYLRPSVPQAVVDGCNIYYPGRYTQPLTLGPGDHFFPSGVYYFENTLTLQAGARLVAGEGRWAGCTFDAEAAFAPTGPTNHAITGKGATFVLGGAGRIVSTNASLRINRRVSDSTSRGTETVAIRSVNFRPTPPTAPAAVEIPNDVVYVADVYNAANTACNATLSTTVCLQRAADHTMKPTATAPVASYTASTLTPADNIVSITQTGGDASSNQFVTDGYVFVPNARVLLNGGTNTDYRLRVSAGVVASSVELGYNSLPTVADNWFVGVLDEPVQRQVELFVSVAAPNGQVTESRAVMEVNVDQSYAINGWTVDPNAGTVVPTTAAPTTAATTTTTIDPGASSTSSTSTTSTTTTTTTTTIPPTTTTTLPPCRAPQAKWSGQYWNDSSASDRLQGTPDLTRQDNAIDFDWGTGSPDSKINKNSFSARWTRDVAFAQAGRYEFTMRGDDGMRLFINDTQVSPIGAWKDQAATTYTFNVPLTACTHLLRFEFYENGGDAVAKLNWTYLGP